MIPYAAPLALAFGLMAAPGLAMTLSFPAPVTQTADQQETGSARLPIAAFDGQDVAMRNIEGQVSRQAWRLATGGLTTQQILAPLKTQLQADGFKPVFECHDAVCGGYDFRFAAEVLGEPQMHVDLGDFRYLLAENKDGVSVALLVSRSPSNGFVQLTRVGDEQAITDQVVTSTKSAGFAAPIVATGPILQGLAETGRAPLDDLTFQTGSSSLESGEFPSLRALATLMAENPDQQITLVGHTDGEGGLDVNIALSRRRAEAVRDTLVSDYDIARSRIGAEGVGFLAPRAANSTDDGRRANRRVEVILNN